MNLIIHFYEFDNSFDLSSLIFLFKNALEVVKKNSFVAFKAAVLKSKLSALSH